MTVSSLVSATLLGALASTAAADSRPTGVERTGRAVEKATGTTGLLTAPTQGNAFPANSSGRILLATGIGEQISMGMPETKDTLGIRTGAGTTVYPNATSGADFAVQPTTDGARTLIVIKNSSAPKEYTFDLGLPQGAQVKPLPSGGLLVVKDRMPLGILESPWAKDANGNPVATAYRMEGNQVVQTVAFNESTAFPVVADPNWKAIAAAFKKVGGFAKAAAGSYSDFKKWFDGLNPWVRYPLKAVMPGMSLYDLWWHLNH
ncbi:hypothetical protein [Streptomyces sp. NPDC048111]|uniref:hypothetical protein n=1 Tax=Streptomyces sp. NPDC048111 TaxID=3365500 RepID=UPI00371EF5BE